MENQELNLESTLTESMLIDNVSAQFTPVSYTHLDVYKRQGQERFSGKGLALGRIQGPDKGDEFWGGTCILSTKGQRVFFFPIERMWRIELKQ